MVSIVVRGRFNYYFITSVMVIKILRYSNTKLTNITGQTNSAKVFSQKGNSPD